MSIEVINVSSKGQVVLPSNMRTKLDINAGDKLIAYCGEDSIIIKKIVLPSEERIKAGIEKNMMIAKESGLTEQDIFDAIRESRSARNK